MRPRVWATNSSIEAMRIGSGSTTTVAPASQMAWMAVTSARDGRAEDGHVVAGAHPEGLERGGVAAGLVVELGARHGDADRRRPRR